MWIKLEDRKPLYGDYSVLVAHTNDSVEMCHVDDLRWGCSEYTHWMDLPSPPNSEQGESPATTGNSDYTAALLRIRNIVLGRGDSVTKVGKVSDVFAGLNLPKAEDCA